MTREEAIKYLNEFIFFKKISNTTEREAVECFKLAVEALQEHQHYKDLAESYEKTINKLTKAIQEQQGERTKERTETHACDCVSKKGHWLSQSEYCKMNNLIPSGLGCYFWCSECNCGIDYKYFHLVDYNYCPKCGIKMQEVKK